MSYALHTNGSKFKEGGKPSQSGVAVGGCSLIVHGVFPGLYQISRILGVGGTHVFCGGENILNNFSLTPNYFGCYGSAPLASAFEIPNLGPQ